MSIEIGKFNKLQVVNIADHGVYVDGGEEGTILLPNRYVPDGLDIDDWVEVFLYFDSDDLLIATTETPKAFVNTVELLKVIDSDKFSTKIQQKSKKRPTKIYHNQSKSIKINQNQQK